jgi:UDP-GlcNAc:undecaprenyl-phosphate GlcNAc-1-phosphate transferase
MGWFAIHAVIPSNFNQTMPTELYSPVLIIWIMTVPIIETFSIFFTRMKQGRSPFEADRLHLHCLLQDRGWNPAFITPFILLISLFTGLFGYLSLKFGVPDYALLYSWSAVLLGITYFRLKKFGK